MDHFNLIASTNAGACILTDSTEIGSIAPREVSGEEIEAIESDGKIFVYEMGGNGDCKFEVFLSSDSPKELLNRSYRTSRDNLLHIPSGKLIAAGVELLSGPKEQFSKVRQTEVEIPSGSYRLHAYCIEPTKQELDGPSETAFDKISRWGCMTTLLFGIATVFAAIVKAWSIVVPIVTIVVLYWVAYLLWYNLSGKRDEKEARQAKELHDGSPSVVVEIWPLGEDVNISQMRGGHISV